MKPKEGERKLPLLAVWNAFDNRYTPNECVRKYRDMSKVDIKILLCVW